MTVQSNVDPQEIHKFSQLAPHWWDPEGPFKPLHQLNPLRLQYVKQFAALFGRRVLDVGCGGGIFSEALAQEQAEVTGIDLAEESLEVARLHLYESNLAVNYKNISIEALAAAEPASVDVVTCMEMLEHVPSPVSVIKAIAQVVKPGGWVFFSTLNRHPMAYLQAVLGAEYVLGMLERGTHDYSKFIQPAELAAWARQTGLHPQHTTGLGYNPLQKKFFFHGNMQVNYLMACQKEEA